MNAFKCQVMFGIIFVMYNINSLGEKLLQQQHMTFNFYNFPLIKHS